MKGTVPNKIPSRSPLGTAGKLPHGQQEPIRLVWFLLNHGERASYQTSQSPERTTRPPVGPPGPPSNAGQRGGGLHATCPGPARLTCDCDDAQHGDQLLPLLQRPGWRPHRAVWLRSEGTQRQATLPRYRALQHKAGRMRPGQL